MASFLIASSLVISTYLLYKYILYPAFVSPLSKIPNAHFTAPFSPFWILWKRFRGKENFTIYAAHQQHGSLIRLGPNELSVNCVDGGIRTIYSGGFEKSVWYSNQFANYGFQNMFTMSDSKSHSNRKRMMSNVYSKSYLQSSPDMRELSQEILFTRFLPLIEASIVENSSVDVVPLNYSATMDVMTAYIFGLSNGSNFLQDIDLRRHFLRLYHNKKTYNFWHAEMRSLLSLLGKLKPVLVPRWVDAANLMIESWWLQMFHAASSSSTTSTTGTEKLQPRTQPIVYNSLSQALLRSSSKPDSHTDHQALLASELLDQGAAGHETSGITLTYYLHQLSQHPTLQSALRSELLTLSPPIVYPTTTRSLPHPRALDALSLLHATILETLRLYPPIPGPQPRVTPSTPTSLANSPPLPAGVRVSANPYSLHRNPDVFPDPEEWRPQRWLETSKESKEEMLRWFWAFGSGGRMCIGRNFAIQQMKLLLAAIYTNYTTSVVDDRGIEQMDSYTAGPRGNRLILKFERWDAGK